MSKEHVMKTARRTIVRMNLVGVLATIAALAVALLIEFGQYGLAMESKLLDAPDSADVRRPGDGLNAV